MELFHPREFHKNSPLNIPTPPADCNFHEKNLLLLLLLLLLLPLLSVGVSGRARGVRGKKAASEAAAL